MTSAVTLGRVRSDIDVTSRAGLPVLRFMDESTAALVRAVPCVAGCFSTVDPATVIVSSTHKSGELVGRYDADLRWAQIEYGHDDPTSFAAMREAGQVAVGVHRATSGEIERSLRMADLLTPEFDFHDEARVVLGDRGGVWGTLSLFRGGDDAPFSEAEIAFLHGLAPALTRGVRIGMLAQLGKGVEPPETGPAVLVIDAVDRIVQSSPGAQSQLALLGHIGGEADPWTAVHGLVSAARRYARGDTDRLPRVRARRRDGMWLVLHAAPLGGSQERAGDVVVTIEEARPQEVIELVVGAFGLSDRERQVVTILLRGADTREIAATMHVSPWTVQDHLKSIFTKAGVASRRELVARVYFDQYPGGGAPGGA